MSINEYNKEDLSQKNKDLLIYFCYNNPDKLCNKLSINKNGYCEDCEDCHKILIDNKLNTKSDDKSDIISTDKLLENYKSREKFIIEIIKKLLADCEDVSKKKEDQTNREYKTHIVLDIFDIIYNNIFFVLLHPKFLITINNKVREFINNDRQCFIDVINKFNYKQHIYYFILDLDTYFEKYKVDNNIIYDNNIPKENYNKFLEDFILFLDKFYDNICIKNKESDKEYDKKNIYDLDYLENLEIILEL
jgi:hypothetical protein